jgi:hypothetical protein
MISRIRTSFLREVGLGLLWSVVAAAGASLALAFFPAPAVLKTVTATLAFVYVCVILGRAEDKTGRVLLLVLWLCATTAAWLSGIGLAGYIAVHIVALWLARALYAYSTLIEAALDLALSLFAFGFGTWAALSTDSLLLASWSFFLVQALHVHIPGFAARLREPRTRPTQIDDTNRRFAEASRVADEALRRIAAR